MKELLHQDGTPMRKYSSPLINELNEEIMNNELNKILSKLDDAVFNIDVKVKAINDKLDELIKALHEYDDDQLEWPEPNDALKEAAAQYNERIHHVSNEEADEDAKWKKAFDQFHEQFRDDKEEDTFNDYGERMSKMDPDDKRTVGNNKYYRKPNTPVTPKKMEDGVAKHERYRQPHKH